ncbi:AMP-binding protein, partial [Nostoc sp. NIES-2111]
MSQTIHALLERGANASPAIDAPDRPTLTYGGLRDLADRTQASLNAMGVGRGDRVAIVLPNGPEMATAFATIAASSTTAPLNLAYREDEFDFYITDLKAKALVVARDYAGPALAVAARHGVRIVRLETDASKPAGWFELTSEADGTATGAHAGFAGPDDGALGPHTSGTTSAPKSVPPLQRNGPAPARHIG